MVSKDLEKFFCELQLDTEEIVVETAAMLKKRYDATMNKVIDIIALWWLHNEIKSLTDAQSHMPELMAQLDGVIDPDSEAYIESMTEMFGQVFTFNYNYARAGLRVENDDDTDALLIFSVLGLASIVWASDGLTYTERMRLRREELKTNIKQIVLRCATLGYGTKRIMDMVKKEMNKSKYRGTQVMVDEANHMANEAVKQIAKDLFDGYEVSEILDMKTCDHCRAMHGKRFDWDEYDIGLTAPQFHNSCRGRIIPIGKRPSDQ